MPELRVGHTAIPWSLRFSDKARRKRIEVTPKGVEVVAPIGTPLDGTDGVKAYVHRKRRWVFDAVRELDGRQRLDLQQHYANGASILYRGRRLRLVVEPAHVDEVSVTYRSRFHVQVPEGMRTDARREAVQGALLAWMKEHAFRDARTWTTRYARALGVEPKGVRLSEQKHMWGSCGKDGLIRVHWRLVQAPAAAMEYVVAHEVCHLVERNHTERFWQTLGGVMGDWRERKALLERWEREQMIETREV